MNAAPDFTITASPGTQTVSPGQNTSYTLTVAPLNGSTQSVTISCTGAPALASCSAATPVVTLNGVSSTAVMINVSTMAASNFHPRNPGQFPSMWVGIFAFAGMLGELAIYFSIRTSRRAKYAFLYLALIVLAASVAGCGTGPINPGTPAGSYTLTLTGTSGTGTSAQSHSTTVTLDVN